MKYFIGIQLSQAQTSTIKHIKNKLNILSTEPHIKIIPSQFLPSDDSFITQLVELRSNFKSFSLYLENISLKNKRKLYLNVNSSELKLLEKEIRKKLNLYIDNYTYKPKCILFSKNYISKILVKKIKLFLNNYNVCNSPIIVKSIIVYEKKHPILPYEPYIKINLD